ncbi:hypothetical protein GQ53DRAFT_815452 [Thozetella sp. PMI_491]|nr:hypothetical protein GQ53DRAFT_815452 [Thozetella sp. PMI_491]
MAQDTEEKGPVVRPSAFRFLLPYTLILLSILSVLVSIIAPAFTRRAELRNSNDPWVRRYYLNDLVWVIVSVIADALSLLTSLLSIFVSGGITSWEIGDCYNFRRSTVLAIVVVFLNLWLALIVLLCYAAWYISSLAAKGDTSHIVQIKLETIAAIVRAVADFVCFVAYLVYAIVLARSEKLEYYLLAMEQEQDEECEQDSALE